MNAQPQKLQMRDAETLEITWSDELVHTYTVRSLRENCPCATCLEKQKAPPPPVNVLPVISAAETQPLRITKMEPMGRYAYAIHFSDGHDTGLYTLDALRELGETPSGS